MFMHNHKLEIVLIFLCKKQNRETTFVWTIATLNNKETPCINSNLNTLSSTSI